MKPFAPLFAIVGIAMLGFGTHIALSGAEPEIPQGANAIEGDIVGEDTVRGPVGAPFVYGEVRVTEAGGSTNPQGTHFRRTFGNANVKVRTAGGDIDVALPNPSGWKVADGKDEILETQTLEGQRLIGDVDPGDRLAPPYAIRVRAVRAGDHVICEVDENDRVKRVFVGDRAALVATRARAEGMRWPAVGVIVVMGCVSILLAYRLATRAATSA